MAAAASASVIILFSGFVREQITGDPPPALDLTRLLPAWVLLPAWFTGAFTEEVLFRSYPIERLVRMTGRPWLVGLVTVAVFTFLHSIDWDWIHVFTAVLPGGIMLTLFYLWRRNLVLNVIV